MICTIVFGMGIDIPMLTTGEDRPTACHISKKSVFVAEMVEVLSATYTGQYSPKPTVLQLLCVSLHGICNLQLISKNKHDIFVGTVYELLDLERKSMSSKNCKITQTSYSANNAVTLTAVTMTVMEQKVFNSGPCQWTKRSAFGRRSYRN